MANNYTGAQKAAILLLSFGEDVSAEIFKHLNEFEIRRIGMAMSRLGRLDETVVDEVVNEFYNILQQNKQFFYGGSDFTKKVLGSAFKGGEAEGLIEQLSHASATFDSLSLIDPRTLAGFIRNEHPQTIALILAHLDPPRFSETLKLVPENLRVEILFRVANLDSVAPEIIDDVDDVLRQEVQALGSFSNDKLGGAEAVANMLNVMDKASEEELLDGLDERDPDLAEQIRLLMFVFDDLAKLDAKSAQELVKAVPQDKWKVALKTATEPVKELVFTNMSARAAEMLKEDMEASGAVKLSDVESVQYEILTICRKLEEEGKVVRGADGQYV